jgi:hypothetical protein
MRNKFPKQGRRQRFSTKKKNEIGLRLTVLLCSKPERRFYRTPDRYPYSACTTLMRLSRPVERSYRSLWDLTQV